MAKIIDGKAIAAQIRSEIKDEIQMLGIKPGLAVILVGDDPASAVYVRNKKRACEEVGIYSESYELPKDTTEARLLELIDTLNKKEEINGILVQLPLPPHINEKNIILAINPEKDVDAFHPVNVGKIVTNDYNFLPCTPAGVMLLLERSGIDIAGKKCVVVGRSNIVGKPQALLMLHGNATVTICHSKTENLKAECQSADILVVAIGKADFITGDMIKDGAVVIDVGMNRRPDGKLTGDVDYASCEPKASFITPVPGGVGPMTITVLMKNTLTSAKKAKGML